MRETAPGPARVPLVIARPVASLVRGPRRAARVRGVYPRAAYLQVGARLLALTAADAERLPIGLHLPLASQPGQPFLGLDDRSRVTLGAGRLTVVTGGSCLAACEATTWDPRPTAPPAGADASQLRARLDQLVSCLAQQAAPDSLAALARVTPASWVPGGTSLDWRPRARDLLMRCLDALQAADASALQTTARQLIGLGPGLTPAADDVLGGVLAAGHFLARTFATDQGRWRAAGRGVRRLARGQTTPLSEALLACAVTGAVGESTGKLLRTLVAPDGGALPGALARTLALGHTSGADVALGILLGARLHLTIIAEAPTAPWEGIW